jgi:nucleotide-binding universal stress UspA family protein
MIHFTHSKILIPVDFSETSLLAIRHGAQIAQSTKAHLYLLHVVNTHFMSQNMFIPVVTLNQSDVESKASVKLQQLADEIRNEYQVNIECITRSGTPASEVVRVAKELAVSLIVMGTHGYSPMQEIMIGSVALKVITRSPAPTMVMSGDAAHKGYRTIVLPIDNTVNSRQKVPYTLEFAKYFGAKVHAIALVGSEEKSDKPAMELVLHQIQTLAKEKGVSFQSEVLENVKNRATATVKYAEQAGADLIVIMTDQDSELSGFFLGPYSQQIIHLSKVPVIAIKPKDLYADPGTFGGSVPGTSGYQ